MGGAEEREGGAGGGGGWSGARLFFCFVTLVFDPTPPPFFLPPSLPGVRVRLLRHPGLQSAQVSVAAVCVEREQEGGRRERGSGKKQSGGLFFRMPRFSAPTRLFNPPPFFSLFPPFRAEGYRVILLNSNPVRERGGE